MTDVVNPAAPSHLPPYITAFGETDVLMIFAGIFLVAGVLAIGVFFLWLHSLPERMVHNRWQYDIVAVLCLLALFTHIHAFWIAALLLAYVKLPEMHLPNIGGTLDRIAVSLDRLAAREAMAAPHGLPSREMSAVSEPVDSGDKQNTPDAAAVDAAGTPSLKASIKPDGGSHA